MPRTKGAKDGRVRKEKSRLTSKQLYAKAEKYKLLADAEKEAEDARKNSFFLSQSKTKNVFENNDSSIISSSGSSGGSDSDDNCDSNIISMSSMWFRTPISTCRYP